MTDQTKNPTVPLAPTPPREVHKVGEPALVSQPILNNEMTARGLVKDMSESKAGSKNIMLNLLLSVLVVTAGIASGWGLSMVVAKPNSQTPEDKAKVDVASMKVGEVYGNQEVNGFKDTAEGVLLKGGLDGEGSHRILRPGGKTQTAYLTSSVVDLDPFVNHKVKVWGDTFAAQKANWLMDVGRVEIIELNAEKPFEE